MAKIFFQFAKKSDAWFGTSNKLTSNEIILINRQLSSFFDSLIVYARYAPPFLADVLLREVDRQSIDERTLWITGMDYARSEWTKKIVMMSTFLDSSVAERGGSTVNWLKKAMNHIWTGWMFSNFWRGGLVLLVEVAKIFTV